MKDKEFLTEKERREKDFAEETWGLAIFFLIVDIVFYGIKQNMGLLMVVFFVECFAMCFFALASNNSPMNSKKHR
jgi:hypothetical protein